MFVLGIKANVVFTVILVAFITNMFKVTKDMNLLIFKDEYKAINGMGQKVGYEGLEKILAAIETCRTRLDANVNMELAMELLLLTMKRP